MARTVCVCVCVCMYVCVCIYIHIHKYGSGCACATEGRERERPLRVPTRTAVADERCSMHTCVCTTHTCAGPTRRRTLTRGRAPILTCRHMPTCYGGDRAGVGSNPPLARMCVVGAVTGRIATDHGPRDRDCTSTVDCDHLHRDNSHHGLH